MTSRPLFISVEESTVIFGPILQVGWASASSTVTAASSAPARPRNGPPLAVSSSRADLPACGRRPAGTGGGPSARCRPGPARPRAGPRRGSGHHRARRRSATPCWPGARRRPAPMRGQRDPQAGEADHGVEGHVGRAWPPRPAPRGRRPARCRSGSRGPRPGGGGGVRHHDHVGAELAGLGGQQLDRAAGAEGDDPVAPGLGRGRRRGPGCRSTPSSPGWPPCGVRPSPQGGGRRGHGGRHRLGGHAG